LPAIRLGTAEKPIVVRLTREKSDHRRQRALDQRPDADYVCPALARQAEVVDVDNRHVRPARGEQLEGIRRGGRHAHLQLRALRGVDPRVDRVGLEVERERRRL
jgi:hypothetical protein